MAMSDPLADMLTRVRNGQSARMTHVTVPSSKLKKAVLDVLKNEGYIRGYSESEVRKNIYDLKVELKYFDEQGVIKKIRRVSRPGRRIYVAADEHKPVYNGLGISILTTPLGVMSDITAKQKNIGGELLCQVF